MDELVVDGEKYISSKRAARLSGYAKDYIGQLCRAGKIESKMVGRSWYVKESAIKDHRKTFQGGAVVDDKLWVEGKNGLEFKGFGSVDVPAPRPRIDDDNIKIHYESDARPLIPDVGKKKPAPLAAVVPEVPSVEESEEVEEEVETSYPVDISPREQTEEVYDVAVHAVEIEPRASMEEVVEEESEEDEVEPVRAVPARAMKRRTSFRLLCLCLGILIGTAALLSLVEVHSTYRNIEAEEFEYVSSHISFWNMITDIRSFLGR